MRTAHNVAAVALLLALAAFAAWLGIHFTIYLQNQ